MKIKLNSPVSFLPDLNDEELTTIRKLYKNEIFLIRDESGLKLINSPTEGAISGQAAINTYLQTLRKKPGSEIDVIGVLSFANSFQQLRDLLYLLEHINWQNKRGQNVSNAVRNLFTYLEQK